MKKLIVLVMMLALVPIGNAIAQINPKLQAKLEQQAKEIETKMIAWRRSPARIIHAC